MNTEHPGDEEQPDTFLDGLPEAEEDTLTDNDLSNEFNEDEDDDPDYDPALVKEAGADDEDPEDDQESNVNLADKTVVHVGEDASEKLEDQSDVQVGHSTLMMHMAGSKMYHNDAILKSIDMAPFLPDSKTYVAVTHAEIVEEVKHNIRRFFDVPIVSEHYALSSTKTKDGEHMLGARMFGLLVLDLSTGDADDDFSLCIGMKNALDGSTRAAVCIGHQVFVCDNLCFSGELMSAHRHTKNIHNSLPGLILNTIKQGPDQFFKDQELKKRLKEIHLNKNEGYKILCDMAVEGILKTAGNAKSQFVQAIKHHRIPPYGVFANDSAWSLLNAVTFGIQQNTNPAGIIGSSHAATEYFRKVIRGS